METYLQTQGLIFKGLTEEGSELLNQLRGKTLTQEQLTNLFKDKENIETSICEQAFL